jgi:hypothetical protein
MWIGSYPFQLRKRSELAAREGLIPPPEGFTRTGTSRQPRTGLSHQAAPQKQRGVDMIAPRQQRPHRQDDAKQHQVDADLVEPAPRTDRPVLLENRRKDLKRPKLVSRSPPLMGASSASWRTTCTWQPPCQSCASARTVARLSPMAFRRPIAADPAMQALAVAPSVEGNLTRLGNGAYRFIYRRSDDGSPRRSASVTSI